MDNNNNTFYQDYENKLALLIYEKSVKFLKKYVILLPKTLLSGGNMIYHKELIKIFQNMQMLMFGHIFNKVYEQKWLRHAGTNLS